MAGMDMLHTQLTDVMWVWAVGVGGMKAVDMDGDGFRGSAECSAVSR